MTESHSDEPSLADELKDTFSIPRALETFATPPPSDPREALHYMRDIFITGGLFLISTLAVWAAESLINATPLLPHSPTTGDIQSPWHAIEFIIELPIIFAGTTVLRHAVARRLNMRY